MNKKNGCKNILKLYVFLIIGFLTVGLCGPVVFAAPSISLSPSSGFSTIMISGTDFSSVINNNVTVYWEGNSIPTFPSKLVTDYGEFTAIINVPNQTNPGFYNVTVIDSQGLQASVFFTVVNMTGPEGLKGDTGPQGPEGISGGKGDTGDQGIQGIQGEKGDPGPQVEIGLPLEMSIIFAFILSVIALILVFFHVRKKKPF